MQIKTITRRYHLTIGWLLTKIQSVTIVDKDVEKQIPYTIYLKKLKSGSWINTYTLMFTAAVFKIVKAKKQSKCPLVGEWLKKMYHIHMR